MNTTLTIKAAEAIAGTIGYPSKMPGTSYGIPAAQCITGTKLRAIEGSTCAKCYAFERGNYQYSSVKKAQAKRLAGISNPDWVEAMVFLLTKEYNKACQEFTDLIRKPELLAAHIRRAPSNTTGRQSRTLAVGSGSGHSTDTDTAITRKRAAQGHATYQLTLPVSGATVELSRKDITFITSALCDATSIQIISNSLRATSIDDITQTSGGAINLPDALRLKYYFRWHDSGDLQSRDHLAKICAVARATPWLQHWLPTREAKIVRDFVRDGCSIPANLTIRLSATMVDGPAPKAWPLTSTVHNETAGIGHRCPAPQQGNECGQCRACWNKEIPNVTYHVH